MKKKGLIVATIVMVLVLAVSLTTATYAWFSSSAQAEVENLTILTTASTGVQIAVYDGADGNTYYNGTIEYDGTQSAGSRWEGELDGFGTLLDFANINIGTMFNAVTNRAATDANAPAEAKFVYTPVSPQPTAYTEVATYYYVNANGSIVAGSTATEGNWSTYTGGVWCTKAGVADGTFYRPTGHDAKVQPYGYFAAEPNTKDSTWTTYYDIPLAMQTVKDTHAVLCSITIKSSIESTVPLYPGMAAATRVRITPVVDGEEQTAYAYTFEPFNAYTYNAGTMTKSGDAAYNSDGVLNFVVATGAISPSDVFKLKIEIWVEGTDGECNTVLTNSTNFNVDFGFDVYDDEYTSGDITKDETTYKVIPNVTQTVSAGA